jgi:hypothetical protein
MAPRYLTKSRFKLAVSCPTKLYYNGKSDYANTNDGNDFIEMLADGGFQVGELAKLKYPDGIEITSKQIEKAIAETQTLLQQENVTLFEPAIVHDNFLVRVDVLVKRGKVLEIIEVKAKSYSGDPASLSGKRKPIIYPYVQDVAFQKYVLELAFPDSTVTAFLLMPDKSKHATVNGMNQLFKVKRLGRNTQVVINDQALFPGLADTVLTCVNVDYLANEVLKEPLEIPGGQGTLDTLAKLWANFYQRDEKLPPIIGAQCGSCEFKSDPISLLKSGFHECWKQARQWSDHDFEQGTVLDIWNFRGKDKLIQKGICKLSQVTVEDLKLKDHDLSPLSNAQRQWLQVNGLPAEWIEQGYYLDVDGLTAAMSSWVYPLHLIDFETAAVALPFHAGCRPYEQIAFQFSHHVLEADGSLRHAHQFLHDTPGEFPNYHFVRALREALGHDQGTVFRWSHHENSILNAIKGQLDADTDPPADQEALIEFIIGITKDGDRAMVDLADIARKHYFHPSTKGSCSIKKIFPAVLTSCRYLRDTYHRPIYGASGGIPSLNFENIAWWQTGPDGRVLDPYKLLAGELDDEVENEDNPGINQGGAASNAYLRLQFEDLSSAERASLCRGLKRYCELDTLAMGFVLQSWYFSNNSNGD